METSKTIKKEVSMKTALCLSTLLILALTAQAAEDKSTSVKKSATGVCHSSESRFYAKLKHFTSYDSLKACLDSGGSLPGKKAQK
jgi:hypothetical protein